MSQQAISDTLLQDAASLFRGLLENEMGGVYVIQDDVFAFVNQRFCDLFGFAQDEICGQMGPVNLTAREFQDIAQTEIDNRLSGRTKTGHYQFRALRKDGTSFFAEVFGVRTLYRDRPAIIGILMDVNEQVMLQRQSADHARFVTQLMDAIPIPVFYKGIDYRYLGCNQAFEVFVGLSRQQIIGKKVFDLYPEHLATIYDRADQQLFAQGGVQKYESFIRNGAGIERDVIFTKATFKNAQGDLDGAVGVFQDVTDDKKNQEELRLAHEAFVNSQQAIVVLDGNGVVLKVNPAYCDMTGFAATEVLGQPSHYIRLVGDATPEQHSRCIALQQDGQWKGDIQGCRQDGTFFTEHAVISAIQDANGTIYRHVVVSSDMTEFRRYQHQIEHLAQYDPLTNLANRTLLFRRMTAAIDQAQQNGTMLAVGFLDLDDFKPINDSHGHNLGDFFLVEISQRLAGLMAENDLVARLGGDEFVLVFENVDSIAVLEKAVRRILGAVALPCRVEGMKMQATTSIGIALYPQDGQDPDTLIRHAYQAMYTAKRSGKNRWHFFDTKSDHQIRQGRQFLARVELGLLGGEFRLYYQPKVDLRSGQVVGAEALLRWQHPERGLLGPDEFKMALEDREFAPTLGYWVIRESLWQMAQWQSRGLEMPVSINISANHLLHPTFVGDLRACLKVHPTLSPHMLQIEILESNAIDDMLLAAQAVENCGRLGVSCALDDFGTGYSSLTYLRRMPVELLKIDKSFVIHMLDNRDDLAIVDGVVSLGKAFGRMVIAEGVETIAHGQSLRRLGCDYAQGFGIARPMPADQVPDWVAAWKMPQEWRDS